jgi:hypothetical protein
MFGYLKKPTYQQAVKLQLEQAKLTLLSVAEMREHYSAMEDACNDKIRRLQAITDGFEGSPPASVAAPSAAPGSSDDPQTATGSFHPPRLTAVVDLAQSVLGPRQ